MPDEMKPLIGTYYANFGPFKNTPFQVVFRWELRMDIPSQLVFELREPDKEGAGSLYSPTQSRSLSRKTAGARYWRWSCTNPECRLSCRGRRKNGDIGERKNGGHSGMALSLRKSLVQNDLQAVQDNHATNSSRDFPFGLHHHRTITILLPYSA